MLSFVQEIQKSNNEMFRSKITEILDISDDRKVENAYFKKSLIDSFFSKSYSLNYSFSFSGLDFSFSCESEQDSYFQFFVSKNSNVIFDFLYILADNADELFEDAFESPLYNHIKNHDIHILCLNPENFETIKEIKFVFDKLCDSRFISSHDFIKTLRGSIEKMNVRAEVYLVPKYNYEYDMETAKEICRDDNVNHGDLIIGDDFHYHSISVIYKKFCEGKGVLPSSQNETSSDECLTVEGNINVQIVDTLDHNQFPSTYRMIPSFVTDRIQFPLLFYSDLLEDSTIQSIELGRKHKDFLFKYLDELNFGKLRYSTDGKFLYVRRLNECYNCDVYDLKTKKCIDEDEELV